ncbi:hypothetical protein EC968_009786 [Mortierella alpina]|nr:hypothetical protein EC968_009786 [Mortierella alpina]
MAQSASGSESVSSAILSLLSAARSAPEATPPVPPSTATPCSSASPSSSTSSSSSASSSSADTAVSLVADPLLSEPLPDRQPPLPTQPASSFIGLTGITLSPEAFLKAALELQQQLNSSAAAGGVESALSQVLSTAASTPLLPDSSATTMTTTTTLTSTLPTVPTVTTESTTESTELTETTEITETAAMPSSAPTKLPSERKSFVSAVVIPPLKKTSHKPYALSNSPRTPSPSPSLVSSADDKLDFKSKRGAAAAAAAPTAASTAPVFASTARSAFYNRVEGQKNRFTFTEAHNALLDKVFEVQPYPNKAVKAELSQRVGCSEVQVQNWFSRRRTRAQLEQQDLKEKQELLQKLGGKPEKLVKSENQPVVTATVSDSSAERSSLSTVRAASQENADTLEGMLGSATVAKYSGNISKTERPVVDNANVPSKLRPAEIAQRVARLSRGGAIVKAEDVKTVVQLMSAASDYEGRKYILTALLCTKAMVVLEKFVRSNGPAVFRTWILEASKNLEKSNNRDMVLTSIAILKALPFDLESLKDSKLGKLMKGLSSDKEADKDISRQASQLVEKWRQLISETRSEPTEPSAAVKSDNDKKRSGRERDGDRLDLFEGSVMPLPKFSKVKATQPVEKTKKPQIAENAGFFKELSLPPRPVPRPVPLPNKPVPLPSKPTSLPTKLHSLPSKPVKAAPLHRIKTQVKASPETAGSSPTVAVSSPSQQCPPLVPPKEPSPFESSDVSAEATTNNSSGNSSSNDHDETNSNINKTVSIDTAVSTVQIADPAVASVAIPESTAMDVDASSDDTTLPQKKQKKVVRFKAEHELFSIRYIEARSLPGELEEKDEEEEGDEYDGSDGYDLDQEMLDGVSPSGQPVFILAEPTIRALVQGEEWRIPAPLQLEVEPSRGAQSVEKDVQERREMETLSANYLQVAYIPPSPAEPNPEPEAANTTAPRTIALFQPTNDHSEVLMNSLSLLQQFAATTNQPASSALTAGSYLGGYSQSQQQSYQAQPTAMAASAAASLAAMYGSTNASYAPSAPYQSYQQPYQQQQAAQPTESAQALLNMLQQVTQQQQQQQQPMSYQQPLGQQHDAQQNQQPQQSYTQNTAYGYYYSNNT